MKKVLLFMVCALMGFALSAQVKENFSDYTVGGKIAQQAQAMGRDYWTTWSNAPGSAEDGVVGEMSGNKVGSFSWDNDQVLLLGGKTTGAWNFSMKLWIPTGKCGFFNILGKFAGGSSIWALQVYFGVKGEAPNTLTPGVGTMHIDGANSVGFTFTHDAWTDAKVFIDLDNDYAEIFINGTMIKSWVYTKGTFGEGCPRVIDAMDIFPPISTNSDFYVDDIVFAAAPTVLYETSFDDKPNGSYVAQSYPDWWTTWENKPGTIQDALISNEQAKSTPNSAKCTYVAGDTGTDLIFKTGEPTTGVYSIDFEMYIPNGVPAYFNILNHFVPSNPSACQWAVGVYFNILTDPNFPGPGTYVRNNKINTNFTAPSNAWFPVSITVDLDNDEASITINGNHLLTWQYSIDENGDPAPRKLAAVDFFPPQTTSVFYFDDFVYTMQGGETFPIMNVIPTEISEEGTALVTVPILVTNEGTSMGDYFSWIVFDGAPSTGTNQFTLTYSGDTPGGGVGYQNQCTVEAAAKYTLDMYCDKVGTYIKKVSYYMYQSSADNKLTARVYGVGNYNNPGEILAEVTINNPVIGDWNVITLPDPGILLDGQDIWVAFEMIQPTGGYLISYDDGLAIENSNWVRSNGGGWGQMFTVGNPPQSVGRVMIKAFALGEGGVMPGCWLSLTGGDTHGTVPAGGSKTYNAVLDPATLEEGVHTATIFVSTSDEDNPLFEIPVTFAVGTSINTDMKEIIVDGELATLETGTKHYTIKFTYHNEDPKEQVFIEAIPVSPGATVTGDTGEQPVEEGTNNFNFKVTAQDGVHFADYTLAVIIEVIIEAVSEIDNTVQLYPNPVIDYLYLKSDFPVEQVTVYDLTGRVVKQVKQPG
ncbi:MAG: T9SS type A sorting domain-containing protein, partial [Bacteroidales bacterium]|nr:T9SS type A sorting domain-containing protein [Bacteroidales bacterium]